MSLALLSGAGDSAASALLRFKGLAVEEEAFLAHLARHSNDLRIRNVATQISHLHAELARQFYDSGANAEQVKNLTQQLDVKEVELWQMTKNSSPYLQVQGATVGHLRASLPARSALLDIREYRPVDFQRGKLSSPRWAGVLITAQGEVLLRDLGATTGTARLVKALLSDAASSSGSAAAQALQRQFLKPFAAALSKLDRLYLAPDGVLYLLPFGLLRDDGGQRLLETLDVRVIQSGRDLLRPLPAQFSKGLIAVGGIDFDLATPPRQMTAVDLVQSRTATADTFRDGFKTLRFSRQEVEMIGSMYRVQRRDEAVTIAEDAQPSKSWLLSQPPPRVLHLATHGFYREPKEPADRPMLLAGIALAGANRSLQQINQDGILYALEAQDLNLEGTELVVLSACKTAQGQIDYADGVSGLVRALRTAGARNVLVTLRPVDDQGAADFMQRFYFYMLKQNRSDPVAALRDAQREQITTGTPDTTWTSFFLVGT